MKHHLTALIVIARLTIGFILLSTLISFIISATFIFNEKNEKVHHFAAGIFGSETPDDILYLGIYLSVYGLLLLYGALGATRVFYCLLNIKNGGLFYENQANEFKRAGNSLILFAVLDYTLNCATDIFLFNDFTGFVTGLPVLLLLYLIGKSLLAANYIIQKGETIKYENDLTI